MTAREAINEAQARLDAVLVPDAVLACEWLLSDLLHIPRLQLKANPDIPLSPETLEVFNAQAARLMAREPLQYIQGKAAFMGHEFIVRPPVLIPRADTETLCEQALRQVKPGFRVLDLCCGSGCLGIAVKLSFPACDVWASDVSDDAVALTRENALRLGAEIQAARGDLFEPLSGLLFDLVLCNPPYIKTSDLPHLQPEVLKEPALALNGGPDGLDFYRRVLREIGAFLVPGGSLLFEVGDGRMEDVAALLSGDFSPPSKINDLAGRPRVLETRRLPGVH